MHPRGFSGSRRLSLDFIFEVLLNELKKKFLRRGQELYSIKYLLQRIQVWLQNLTNLDGTFLVLVHDGFKTVNTIEFRPNI